MLAYPVSARRSLNIADLSEAITATLRGRQEPCSVWEVHRALLEHYDVDYGLVLAVVVYETAQGRLHAIAGRPRSHAS